MCPVSVKGREQKTQRLLLEDRIGVHSNQKRVASSWAGDWTWKESVSLTLRLHSAEGKGLPPDSRAEKPMLCSVLTDCQA